MHECRSLRQTKYVPNKESIFLIVVVFCGFFFRTFRVISRIFFPKLLTKREAETREVINREYEKDRHQASSRHY